MSELGSKRFERFELFERIERTAVRRVDIVNQLR
jgi:hypothetical protein